MARSVWMAAGCLVWVCACTADKVSSFDSNDSEPDSAHVDLDGDGYLAGLDCNDGDPNVHDGASELCNDVDDDCDGAVDDDPVDAPIWYVDGDGDSHGSVPTDMNSCEAPGAAVGASGDCDDDDPSVFPGAAETCDGVDEDCDGETDEEASDAVECVPDLDSDGSGQDTSHQLCCALGDGWAAPGVADCDDTNRSVHPGGLEVCNLLDDDCDGAVDEDDEGDDTADSLCDLWQEHVVSDADIKILGDADAGQRSSFLMMDADADGYDDLWLGAQSAIIEGLPGAGLAYLLPGPMSESGLAADMATATIQGTTYDQVGHRLADAGDLNGDSYPELWVVASVDQTTVGIGSVHLVTGPVSGTHSIHDSDLSWVPDATGWTLYYTDLDVGDYDADGSPDLAIGASAATGDAGLQSGMAWIIRGDSSSGTHNLSDAALVLEASDAGDRIGWSVAITGSTTGDGVDDLVIGGAGIYSVDIAGLIWVIDEAPPDGTYLVDDIADHTLVGEQAWDNAAGEIMDLGDMNGDGYTDFGLGAIGESSAATEAGAVYVLYGPVGTRTSVGDADVKLQGVDEKSMVHLIAGEADIDADGSLDIVASGFNSGDGDRYGTAFLVRGPLESGTWSLADADAIFEGEAYQHYAGSGLAVSGDTNQDGYPELVIGASGYQDETFDGGVLYLYFGQPF